ncbi:MAG: hypothetical protein Q8K43_10530 [Sulfurimicrobium sp.]|nr:hypothetical protein [Gallionella sp.]MDP1898311.1 hypothetical protein [Sulfurimicrobium sp.]
MNDKDYLWDKRHAVLQRIELSTLYHQKRERFFTVCDKLGNAAGVIGGSAALASLSNPDLLAWIALAITVVSSIALVFGFPDRARRHADLAKDFRQLESAIVGRGERDFTEQDVSAWDASTRMFESTEPPALGALVVLCQNELARAQGHAGYVVKMNLMQRLGAHFVDFNVSASPVAAPLSNAD